MAAASQPPNFIRIQTYGPAPYEVPYHVVAGCPGLAQYMRPEYATPAPSGKLHVMNVPMWPSQLEALFVKPEETYIEEVEEVKAPLTVDEAFNELVAAIQRESRKLTWFRCGPNYSKLLQVIATMRTQVVRTAVQKDWMKYGVSIHDLVDATVHGQNKIARRHIARFTIAAGEEIARELVAVIHEAMIDSFRGL